MATPVGANGVAVRNSLTEWERITIRFDDGTKRDLPNVTATLRQLFQLAKEPWRYKEILAVNDGA
jgi:hypothetical protein